MRSTTRLFVVPVLLERRGAPCNEFLYSDGLAGPDEALAVRFRTYTSATMLERNRIEKLTHEYAGGLREFLDLSKGCEAARVAVLRQVERELWPMGRPPVEGEEHDAQEEAFNAAWSGWDSIEKDGYASMRSMIDRVVFLATWTVLVVQPPDGWANLADRPGLDDGTFYAIWNAWLAATEETRAGK